MSSQRPASRICCHDGGGEPDQLVKSELSMADVSFTNPPVNEVVAGVAFQDLGAEAIALLAGFWRETARDTFPQFQTQPPYKPVIEQFTDSPMAFPLMGLQMMTGYPSPRFWAVGDGGQYLLQLQSDWFACNWRRVRPDDEYYRWARRRQDFLDWYDRFSSYVERVGSVTVAPTQCEVTYINHISPGAIFRDHTDFNKVFTLRLPEIGRSPEQLSAAARYGVASPTDPEKLVGRLHVDINAALNQRNQPIYTMQLTVRGAPQGPSHQDVIEFLDLGRQVIDDAFIKLTTDEIQAEWGRNG